MRWWPVTTVVVLVVISGGALAMWLLGVWVPIPKRVLNPDQLRLDRIKTGLTVAAGLAAGATLLMTLRRQALNERAQRFAESDALEQRTTALYVAAAEQLGSDKAAVRLAGLYALERLGQDNSKLRQTVFDVWCAYLRMPYTPPIDVLRRNAKASPERPAPDAEPPDRVVEAERRQELEVRLTAQRLLGAHLSLGLAEAGMRNYWLTSEDNQLIVNLVGAVLVDFNASECSVSRVNLSGAQFHGRADLSGARFHGIAELSGARFHGIAELSGARFHGIADLGGARFHGDADLGGARFHGIADLSGTRFHGDAGLIGAQFHSIAGLGGAQFHGDADLRRAQFHGLAYLGGAQFHGLAYLGGAQFHGDADLRRAQFHGDAALGGAQFHGDADLRQAQFNGALDMTRALATSAVGLPDGWLLSAATTENDELRLVVRAGDVPSELHSPDVAS